MRRYIVVCIAIAMLMASMGIAVAAPAEQKVTGGGWFILDEEKVTLSFTAQSDGDNVKGEVQCNLRPYGTFHADVTGLSVDGNTALISATITKSSEPDAVGLPIVFAVLDDGEGKDAEDLILFIGFGGITSFNGNIQVK